MVVIAFGANPQRAGQGRHRWSDGYVDPVSGDFLFYSAAQDRIYALDPSNGVWTDLATEGYPLGTLGTANDLAAVSVPSYGVVIFVHAARAKMWVYKHGT